MKSLTAPSTGHFDSGTVPSAFKRVLVLAAFAALAGCASPPSRPPEVAPPAPAVVSMEEWLSRGDAAATEGDHTKARDAWRAATRDYPTAKQPWLKLSEDYFNASDYGNAVLAAQEALQRDPRDRMANSVLAVSGLRLTAGSLAALREGGAYPVGSRNEAVNVTRALREALGEPVLVPPPEPVNKPRARARASGPAASGAAPPAPRANVPPPAPQPSSSGDPFKKLKD